MTDRVRVLRVLEYEGPREWVENTLANNAVKGEKRFHKGGELYVIRESIIGETPTVLKSEPEQDDLVAETAREIERAYGIREQEKRPIHKSYCDILFGPYSMKCNCGAEQTDPPHLTQEAPGDDNY